MSIGLAPLIMSERVYPETKGGRRQKTRVSRITIKRDQKGTKKEPKAASSTLTPKRDQKGTKIKLSLLSLHMASKTSLNQGSKCRRKLLICLEQSQSRSEKSISISLRSSINAISLRSSIPSLRAQYLYPSKLELNLGSISLQSRTQQFRHHEDCNYKTATT